MDNGSKTEVSIELLLCTIIFIILVFIQAYRLGDNERIKNWFLRMLLRPAIIWGCFTGFLASFVTIFMISGLGGEFEERGVIPSITEFFSYLSPSLLCVSVPIILIIGGNGGSVGEYFAKRIKRNGEDYIRQSVCGAIGGGVTGVVVKGFTLLFILSAG